MSGKTNLGIGIVAAIGAVTGAALVAGSSKMADEALNRNYTKVARKAFPSQPCGLPPYVVEDEALRSRMEATSIVVSERIREWLEATDVERVTVSADSGRLRLVGCVYYAARATRSWVILAHDYRSNRRSMEKYAEMYSQQGFNVLSVDLRAHGESEGTSIGMGWMDGQDILEWVGYLIGRFGADISIVLHGQSMGAAAMVNASAWSTYPQVVAIVADSCPSTIRQAVLNVMRNVLVLPAEPFYLCMRLGFMAHGGFDLNRANPIETTTMSKTPTLFIHGAADTVVPPSAGAELYDACAASCKRLHVIPEAGHIAGFFIDPQNYESTVFEFLQRIGVVEYETA